MVLPFPLVMHHLKGQGKCFDCCWPRMLHDVPFVCSELVGLLLSLWKLTFGRVFVETEESAKLADIYFCLLLPSQSEVQSEEIEKHHPMLERGNIHLPLHLPQPQSHGRRVGRKGKNCSVDSKGIKTNSKGLPRVLLLQWKFCWKEVLLWLDCKSALIVYFCYGWLSDWHLMSLFLEFLIWIMTFRDFRVTWDPCEEAWNQMCHSSHLRAKMGYQDTSGHGTKT